MKNDEQLQSDIGQELRWEPKPLGFGLGEEQIPQVAVIVRNLRS